MALPNPWVRLHSSMLSRGIGLFTLAAGLASGACSSGGPPSGSTSSTVGAGGTDTDGSTVSCVSDPRVDTYTADLRKAGQRGALIFTLLESNPAPPARGTNVLKLKIANMDGMPSTGEAFSKLTMPDHGHPTPVQPVTTFDPSTGVYTLDPAYLFMPGVWRIQIDAYPGPADAGPPLDTGVYFFCIEG